MIFEFIDFFVVDGYVLYGMLWLLDVLLCVLVLIYLVMVVFEWLYVGFVCFLIECGFVVLIYNYCGIGVLWFVWLCML